MPAKTQTVNIPFELIDEDAKKALIDHYSTKIHVLNVEVKRINEILSILKGKKQIEKKKQVRKRSKTNSVEPNSNLQFTIGEKVLLKYKSGQIEETSIESVNDRYFVVNQGSFRKSNGTAFSSRSTFLSIHKIGESISETV